MWNDFSLPTLTRQNKNIHYKRSSFKYIYHNIIKINKNMKYSLGEQHEKTGTNYKHITNRVMYVCLFILDYTSKLDRVF